MTPLLIFLGVPSAVAVSTEAIKLLPHLYQGCWPIGGEVTLISKWAAFSRRPGGIGLWVLLFSILRDIGQIDLVIRLFVWFSWALSGC